MRGKGAFVGWQCRSASLTGTIVARAAGDDPPGPLQLEKD